MIKVLKKLYNDKWADLRDFEVKEAIQTNQNIKVVFGNDIMTINPQQLERNKVLINQKPIKSKINQGQEYFIWSYLWEPDQASSNKGYCIKCGDPVLGDEPSLCGRCAN